MLVVDEDVTVHGTCENLTLSREVGRLVPVIVKDLPESEKLVISEVGVIYVYPHAKE